MTVTWRWHIPIHQPNLQIGAEHAYLGPELDSKRDGLHSVRVASDKEAPKQHSRQPIPLGI